MAGKGGDTLRIAISKAVSGDIVDMTPLPLTCATITLTGGEIPIAVDSLIISSPRQITVDGSNAGRIFNHSGTGILSIQYLTLTHGNAGAADGGCVVSGGEVSLSHSTVTSCQTAGHGGGVKAQSFFAGYSAIDANLAGWGAGLFSTGAAMFVHSSVSGNLLGGGVHSGLLSAYYSTFANNATQYNGGAIIAYGTVNLVGSTITGNSAMLPGGSPATSATSRNSPTTQPHGQAGGVWAGNAMTLEDSVISGNTAGGSGGGLYGRSAVTLTDSTVSNNQAGGGGGGVYVDISRTLTMVRSTLDSNTSTFRGGGALTGSATLTNSTVSGNHAAGGGGLNSIVLKAYNSTVAFNVATDTTDSSTGGIFTGYATMTSTIVANNSTQGAGPADVYIAQPAAFLPGSSLIMSCNRTTLSIKADPQLAPLGFHGGSVRTHALSAASPAIDAGANSGNLATDERGGGYTRVVGAAADIGAYERQANDDELFYDGFD